MDKNIKYRLDLDAENFGYMLKPKPFSAYGDPSSKRGGWASCEVLRKSQFKSYDRFCRSLLNYEKISDF
jgi:hypothetical protein